MRRHWSLARAGQNRLGANNQLHQRTYTTAIRLGQHIPERRMKRTHPSTHLLLFLRRSFSQHLLLHHTFTVVSAFPAVWLLALLDTPTYFPRSGYVCFLSPTGAKSVSIMGAGAAIFLFFCFFVFLFLLWLGGVVFGWFGDPVPHMIWALTAGDFWGPMGSEGLEV